MSQTALKRTPGMFRQAFIRTWPCAPAPSKATLMVSADAAFACPIIGENAKPAPIAAVERRKLRLSISLTVF